jgi:hypothetical protein
MKVLLLLLACAVCLLGSIAGGLGEFLSFASVLLTLRVIVLAMLLGSLAMGLCRAVVLFRSLVVILLSHVD